MNKKIILTIAVIVCIVIGFLWLHTSPSPTPPAQQTTNSVSQVSNNATTSAAHTPTKKITEVSITPVTLVQGSHQPFVVSARIDDPTVIKSSVVLVDILPSGQVKTLASLNDDGVDGDLIANDHIFTTQLSLAQYPVGELDLQLVAIFGDNPPVIDQTEDFQAYIKPAVSTVGWATLTDSQKLFSIQVPAEWNLQLVETVNLDNNTLKDVDFRFPNKYHTTLMIISVHTKAQWTIVQTADFTAPLLLGESSTTVFGISYSQDGYDVPGFSSDDVRGLLPQISATFKAL